MSNVIYLNKWYIIHFQGEDDWTATWSEPIIKDPKQAIQKILVENVYVGSTDADHQNPVLMAQFRCSYCYAPGADPGDGRLRPPGADEDHR